MSNSNAWLSTEQQDAIERLAKAFGWDQMSLEQIKILAWAAFHYYAKRIP